jgi:hypothetical protein
MIWVEWSGSGALIVKNSNATSFGELIHLWLQFGQFCFDFRAVTKRSEMPEDMSSGSNGVDWVRSLRKIPTQLRLSKLGVKGASSASFASPFEK